MVVRLVVDVEGLAVAVRFVVDVEGLAVALAGMVYSIRYKQDKQYMRLSSVHKYPEQQTTPPVTYLSSALPIKARRVFPCRDYRAIFPAGFPPRPFSGR